MQGQVETAGAGQGQDQDHSPKLNALQASVIFAMRPPRKNDTMEFDASAGPKPTEVGRMFGVSSKVVRDIWNRKTWARATRHLWTPLEVAASVAQETGVAGEVPVAKVRKPGRPAGAKDGMPRKKSGYSQKPGQKNSNPAGEDTKPSPMPKSSMEALVAQSTARVAALNATKADISSLLCGSEAGHNDCVKALVQLKATAEPAEPETETKMTSERARRPSLMAAELLSGKVMPLSKLPPAGHATSIVTSTTEGDVEDSGCTSEGSAETVMADSMDLDSELSSGASTPETCKRTSSDETVNMSFVAPEANALETLMSLMHKEGKNPPESKVQDLMERVKQLEAENERLRLKSTNGTKTQLNKTSKGRIQKPKNKLSQIRDREAVTA